jgi:hypothetical protein
MIQRLIVVAMALGLGLVCVSSIGCASSRAPRVQAIQPKGFVGHWETTAPADFGAPIGTASLRLEMTLDGNIGTWKGEFKKADGTPNGITGGAWARVDEHSALLRNGPGLSNACRIELVDASTLKIKGEHWPVAELHRVQ